MNRLGFVGAAVVASLVGLGSYAEARIGNPVPRGDQEVRPIARAASGSLEGVVLDNLGAPLPGVAISALGATSAMTLTDTSGCFRLRALPPGPYIVRARIAGFTPSRRQLVDVQPSTMTKVALALRRVDERATRILAAGIVPAGEDSHRGREPVAGTPEPDPAAAPEGDHSEVAWWLRHMKRNVLKSTSDRDGAVAGMDGTESATSSVLPDSFSSLARVVGSPAKFASTLFGDLQLTGEFNLLTAGSFDNPERVFSSDAFSRGVAYVSIGGPAGGRADWSAQGMMTQGDRGSWFLAGAYRRRAPAAHVYDIGVSHSTQRFLAGRSGSVPTASEGTRTAGAVYGIDRWTLTRQVSLAYGGRYSRYGYLTGPGLFSPRVSVTVGPLDGFRIQASVSRRMLAPGAEEFLPPLAAGLWIPPGRTFSSFAPSKPLAVEHARQYDVTVERDLVDRYVLAFRTFYQRVTDQLTMVFGVPASGRFGAIEPGHYYVGSGGDLDARGWGIGLSALAASHVRGTVRYEMTTARWSTAGDGALIAVWAPSAVRGQTERFHDVTGSVETEIPQTATRFFVLYKVNTAFARREPDSSKPGLDGRFDVQVTQSLPFMGFTSTDWQVLLAIRNMFRDPVNESSVYDELLVVRPPKRIVGGVLVRF